MLAGPAVGKLWHRNQVPRDLREFEFRARAHLCECTERQDQHYENKRVETHFHDETSILHQIGGLNRSREDSTSLTLSSSGNAGIFSCRWIGERTLPVRQSDGLVPWRACCSRHLAANIFPPRCIRQRRPFGRMPNEAREMRALP